MRFEPSEFMTTRVLSSIAAITMFVSANPTEAGAQRSPFVERGVCPGEGCGYTVWQATSAVPVRGSPADSVAPIETIAAGELVCAITGEVHTVPGRFVVEREHGRYAPGDTIAVYTYRGEGWFLVEFNGQRYEEDLRFSPWGGSAGSRCELGADCWGRLQEDLDFTWWIRIDDLAGMTGWVRGNDAFDVPVATATDARFFAECDRRRSAGQMFGEAKRESYLPSSLSSVTAVP